MVRLAAVCIKIVGTAFEYSNLWYSGAFCTHEMTSRWRERREGCWKQLRNRTCSRGRALARHGNHRRVLLVVDGADIVRWPAVKKAERDEGKLEEKEGRRSR